MTAKSSKIEEKMNEVRQQPRSLSSAPPNRFARRESRGQRP